MKTSRLVPIFAFLMPFAVSAEILINEVNVNPPSIDGNAEYIELISTTGGVESTDGLVLLLIDTVGNNTGRIEERWNLSGASTGVSGLLVLGNNYPGQYPFGTPLGGVNFFDPQPLNSMFDGMGDGDIGSNNGFTLLLVRGYNTATPEDTDLDAGDDGVLDVMPWTTIVDSIGYDDTRIPANVRQTYALADVTQPDVPPTQIGFSPDSISRKVGDTRANTTDAWFGGEYDDTAMIPTTVVLDESFGGVSGAAATPAAPNAAFVIEDIRINEVNVSPPVSGDEFEYVELISVEGDSRSAGGYHVVILENTVGAMRGDVLEAWSLNGLVTGTNGLLLLGNSYEAGPAGRPRTPFFDYVDPATMVSDIVFELAGDIRPPTRNLNKDDIRNNDTLTVLLVTGYDPDAVTDFDTNDDGVVDLPAGVNIVDSIGFNRSGQADTTYSPADVTQAMFQPENVSRIPGDLAANTADSWYGGDFGGENQFSIVYNENFFPPTRFKGHATPGRANVATAPVAGDIFLNEVNINVPPSSGNADDGTEEFIELVSASGTIDLMTDLSVLIVNTEAGANFGMVEEEFDISNLSTGPGGLCVIGDSYNDNMVLPFRAAREDPGGLNSGDISPNNGLAVLLVSGFTGNENSTDLDTDDDGILDVFPWSSVLDGVGLGGLTDSVIANVSQAGYVPDNLSRLPGRTSAADRMNSTAWYGGEIVSGEVGLERFSNDFFGPFRGGVTRGFANHAAEPVEPGSLVINELVINPRESMGSSNAEFVELVVSTLDSRSLSGYSLLLLDGDGAGVGDVKSHWDLSGFKTGENGLLLLGDGYDSSIPYMLVPTATEAASPLGMQAGDLEANDSFTLLLVRGVQASLRENVDLDINDTDMMLNNDGILDIMPWNTLADGVGFREFNGGIMMNEGVTYAGAQLTQEFEPDTFARIGDVSNLNASTTVDWYGGELFPGGAQLTVSYSVAADDIFNVTFNNPRVTPGNHNLGGSIQDLLDNDGDGLVNLLEDALNTDRDVPDNMLFPMALTVSVGGEPRLAIMFSRIAGGTGSAGDYTAGTIRYQVEVSTDLITWVADSSLVELDSAPMTNGDGVSETLVVRLVEPVPDGDQRQFLRLRATRLP